MSIGINDLDDDDLMLESPSLQVTTQHTDTEDDFLADYLKTKGIDDISKIKFENDNNEIEEKSWESLTKEEKFNILNTPLEQKQEEIKDDNNLSEEELELINNIRLSNLSPSKYIESLKEDQVIQEPTYKIDDLSDDELYLLDLESRVGEISDELAVEALNSAKQNEELFKKLIEGIRKEYKEREDYLLQLEQLDYELKQQEAYNLFQDSVIEQINNFNSIGNLDLNFDDSDKEELAQFMLSRDEAGNNYLWQALQDPETLVKAAWFILNGDEALNNISEYFINLIKLISENQYKKGLEEGKNNKTSVNKPLVVINNNKTTQHRTYNSINDLDDDD